jgi:aspartate kinase
MCILSLVGKLQNMVGIAGRMFTTLAQGDVNIYMISQGSSEINISCVIAGQDAVKALNLIHQSCLQIKPEGAKGRSEVLDVFSLNLMTDTVGGCFSVGPWLF